MSDAVKIAIGVTAVAVAGYFVATVVLKPTVVPRGTAPSNTGTAFVSGIVSGIAGFGSLFKSAPANAPMTNISTPYVDPNQGIDPLTGGVYLGPTETYGPPAP